MGGAGGFRGLSAVTLGTHDMARAVAFYEALGLTVTFGGPDAPFTTLAAGVDYVNLVAQPAERRWSWWGRYILHVESVDTVDEVHRRAVAAGLEPEAPPKDAVWGERYFHLTDPDGHELSIACPLEG